MQVPYRPKTFAFALLGAFAVSTFSARFHGGTERSDSSPEAPDTREWGRQEIVGTWSQESSQQGWRWVFTEDGTYRQYRRSESGTYELSEIHNYSVVGQYKGTQAPDDIAGYLEFTDSNGDTRYMTIESIQRGEKRPHLYVGTHGMAGNTESLYFMPPRVFE